MNWYGIYKELSAQLDLLSNRASLLKNQGEVSIETLMQAEPQESEILDEVCLEYAKTGNWTLNLTQTQKLLIYIRMGHAAQFAKYLGRAGDDLFPSPSLGLQKSKYLAFLLVDYWKFAGRSRWMTT